MRATTDLALAVLEARGAVVTDLGRRRAHDGLATGGARDQGAARRANALTGRAADAPVVEVVLGRLTVRADREALVAVAGPDVEVAIEGVSTVAQPTVLPAGARLRIGVATGVTAYLAVAGDWAVPRFAGSAAPDPGLGFGTVLEPGQRIRVASAPARLADPALGVPLLHPAVRRMPTSSTAPGLLPGPDLDDGLRRAIRDGDLRVDPRSDHVGVRLTGDLPTAPATGERLSRGVPVGAVELPGSPGELIVLQRGRSLTAGYPIVAVAPEATRDLVAQLRPGEAVRFHWTTRAASVAALRRARAEEDLARTRVRGALDALGTAFG